MKKIQVIIERSSDGKYTAYTQNFEKFGLIGYGCSVVDTIDDFLSAYDEIKDIKGAKVPELIFDFKYDTASFLDFYKNIMSKSGLEVITGIHQKQLWHYASGTKKPRPETVKKIEKNLHKFADELKQIHFVI